MSHQGTTGAGASFMHQAAIYGSDEEFLAMAVPFIEDGLARKEPVLAATTATNIDLLSDALGARADDVEYANTSSFGRSPAQRVAGLHRYWKRCSSASATGHVRILVEPLSFRRSRREVLGLKRLEAGLNTILADTNIWMICPYDTRVLESTIVADVLRTHPAHVEGSEISASPEFVEPQEFARSCDADPLPAPPADAAMLPFTGDLSSVRRFAAIYADTCDLTGEALALWTVAVEEIAGYVLSHGSGCAAIRVWEQRESIVCEVHDPGGSLTDRFIGYRPPSARTNARRRALARAQVCDHVDIRSGATGYTLRLHFPGPSSEQFLLAAGDDGAR